MAQTAAAPLSSALPPSTLSLPPKMLSPVARAERSPMGRRGSHTLATSPSMSNMAPRPKRPTSPYLSPHAPFPHTPTNAHPAFSPYAPYSPGATSPYTSAHALHPPYSAPAPATEASAMRGPGPARPRRPGPPMRSTSFCAPSRDYTYALASGGTVAARSPEKKGVVAPALERTLSSLGVEGNPAGCRFGITPPTPPLSPVPVPAIFVSHTSPPRPALMTHSSALTMMSSSSSTGPATPAEYTDSSDDDEQRLLARYAQPDHVRIRGLDDFLRLHGRGSLAAELDGVGEDDEVAEDGMDSVDAVAGKVGSLGL